MGELLHLVQCRGACVGCGPAQSPPCCTKCTAHHQRLVYQPHIIWRGTVITVALWRVKWHALPHLRAQCTFCWSGLADELSSRTFSSAVMNTLITRVRVCSSVLICIPRQCYDGRPSDNAAVQWLQASCQHAGRRPSDQTHNILSAVNWLVHPRDPAPYNTGRRVDSVSINVKYCCKIIARTCAQTAILESHTD